MAVDDLSDDGQGGRPARPRLSDSPPKVVPAAAAAASLTMKTRLSALLEEVELAEAGAKRQDRGPAAARPNVPSLVKQRSDPLSSSYPDLASPCGSPRHRHVDSGIMLPLDPESTPEDTTFGSARRLQIEPVVVNPALLSSDGDIISAAMPRSAQWSTSDRDLRPAVSAATDAAPPQSDQPGFLGADGTCWYKAGTFGPQEITVNEFRFGDQESLADATERRDSKDTAAEYPANEHTAAALTANVLTLNGQHKPYDQTANDLTANALSFKGQSRSYDRTANEITAIALTLGGQNKTYDRTANELTANVLTIHGEDAAHESTAKELTANALTLNEQGKAHDRTANELTAKALTLNGYDKAADGGRHGKTNGRTANDLTAKELAFDVPSKAYDQTAKERTLNGLDKTNGRTANDITAKELAFDVPSKTHDQTAKELTFNGLERTNGRTPNDITAKELAFDVPSKAHDQTAKELTFNGLERTNGRTANDITAKELAFDVPSKAYDQTATELNLNGLEKTNGRTASGLTAKELAFDVPSKAHDQTASGLTAKELAFDIPSKAHDQTANGSTHRGPRRSGGQKPPHAGGKAGGNKAAGATRRPAAGAAVKVAPFSGGASLAKVGEGEPIRSCHSFDRVAQLHEPGTRPFSTNLLRHELRASPFRRAAAAHSGARTRSSSAPTPAAAASGGGGRSRSVNTSSGGSAAPAFHKPTAAAVKPRRQAGLPHVPPAPSNSLFQSAVLNTTAARGAGPLLSRVPGLGRLKPPVAAAASLPAEAAPAPFSTPAPRLRRRFSGTSPPPSSPARSAGKLKRGPPQAPANHRSQSDSKHARPRPGSPRGGAAAARLLWLDRGPQSVKEALRATPGTDEEVERLYRLASSSERESRYAEAERLHMEALRIRQRRYGLESKQATASLTGLALLAEVAGWWLKAEKYYEEAYRGLTALATQGGMAPGQANPPGTVPSAEAAFLLIGLSRCLMNSSRAQEAGELLRGLLADLSAVRPDGDELVCRVRHVLSVSLSRQRRSHEATELQNANRAFDYSPTSPSGFPAGRSRYVRAPRIVRRF
ncbi:hypothetical protein DIPPA_28375 [Diplonema papillatum]|nr:hypothetical protein DIPPA_28375 [Diplonema papillatum]